MDKGPARAVVTRLAMANFPSDLKYTNDHEWTRRQGQRFTVGITQHAVDQLGDITLVHFDVKIGARLEAGKAFGTVESVKAVSDLYAPLTGTVVELNGALDKSPEKLNEAPYAEGWMLVLEAEVDADSKLLDVDAYTKHVASAG